MRILDKRIKLVRGNCGRGKDALVTIVHGTTRLLFPGGKTKKTIFMSTKDTREKELRILPKEPRKTRKTGSHNRKKNLP